MEVLSPTEALNEILEKKGQKWNEQRRLSFKYSFFKKHFHIK